jgi:hypothetical protein
VTIGQGKVDIGQGKVTIGQKEVRVKRKSIIGAHYKKVLGMLGGGYTLRV